MVSEGIGGRGWSGRLLGQELIGRNNSIIVPIIHKLYSGNGRAEEVATLHGECHMPWGKAELMEPSMILNAFRTILNPY
jgi:hypothetical protein